MSRSPAERAGDVRRVVAAAREVARDRASIAGALSATTGLSAEGVELAFARHLELEPSDAEVEALVASAGDAEHVVVVLASNVFVAALRAIAIARAAAPRVLVRPSRREPHFARALVEAARDPALTIDEAPDLSHVARGEVHVYGRDATIREVRARFPGMPVRVRGHGAGMGVALVTRDASLDDAAEALAADVVPFDQRGCLSPRVALVEGDDARADAFGAALDDALTRAATRVPRGVVHDDERVDATRWAATLAYAGRVRARDSHVVGVAPGDAPLLVPPPARHVHVAPVASLGAARASLAPLAPFVVALGSDAPARAIAVAPPHARLSSLGQTQRPAFDGPVDRRPSDA